MGCAISSAYLACCGPRGQRLCLWQERESPVETTLEFQVGRRRRKRREVCREKERRWYRLSEAGRERVMADEVLSQHKRSHIDTNASCPVSDSFNTLMINSLCR